MREKGAVEAVVVGVYRTYYRIVWLESLETINLVWRIPPDDTQWFNTTIIVNIKFESFFDIIDTYLFQL